MSCAGGRRGVWREGPQKVTAGLVARMAGALSATPPESGLSWSSGRCGHPLPALTELWVPGEEPLVPGDGQHPDPASAPPEARAPQGRGRGGCSRTARAWGHACRDTRVPAARGLGGAGRSGWSLGGLRGTRAELHEDSGISPLLDRPRGGPLRGAGREPYAGRAGRVRGGSGAIPAEQVGSRRGLGSGLWSRCQSDRWSPRVRRV